MADFVFRFYTWEDGPNPILLTTEENIDDYVFMKQDGTNIPSSTLTYTSTFVDKHTFAEIPHQLYVNEFEPGSSYLSTDKMKTPFEFKFKCMTNFADKAGTSLYH